MAEMMQVEIATDDEDYPVLNIRLGREGYEQYAYDVPAYLIDALDSAKDVVRQIERAIMEHVGANYPDAADVKEWLEG